MTFEDGEEELLGRLLSTLSYPVQLLNYSRKSVRELTFSGLSIFPEQHTVKYLEKEISLTKIKYGLLQYMAINPGQIFSHAQIYDVIERGDADDIRNAVQCLICSLRKKLKRYTPKEYIQTVRGVGYKFVLPEE